MPQSKAFNYGSLWIHVRHLHCNIEIFGVISYFSPLIFVHAGLKLIHVSKRGPGNFRSQYRPWWLMSCWLAKQHHVAHFVWGNLSGLRASKNAHGVTKWPLWLNAKSSRYFCDPKANKCMLNNDMVFGQMLIMMMVGYCPSVWSFHVSIPWYIKIRSNAT